MNIIEAREKYLNRLVMHLEKPYLAWVTDVVELSDLLPGSIEIYFQHPDYMKMSKGQPESASLDELEKNYRILG